MGPLDWCRNAYLSANPEINGSNNPQVYDLFCPGSIPIWVDFDIVTPSAKLHTSTVNWHTTLKVYINAVHAIANAYAKRQLIGCRDNSFNYLRILTSNAEAEVIGCAHEVGAHLMVKEGEKNPRVLGVPGLSIRNSGLLCFRNRLGFGQDELTVYFLKSALSRAKSTTIP